MPTRVLVTGASGHIGANIVHDLVAHGYKVAAFVRVTSRLTAIATLPVEVRTGDLLDDQSLRAAVDGCELVVHAAAVYRNWTPDPYEMLRTATEGTRNVLLACKDAGVRRVVYTGSSNTVGFSGTLEHPLDETSFNEAPHLPYVKAKVAAERLVDEVSAEVGVPVVKVLPTGVLGRFDYHTTPTTRSFVDIVNRSAPIPFAMNLVDVRDVARCHVLAMEKGRDGERYLAGSDNASVEQLAELIEQITGVKANTRLPPLPVLKVVAAVSSLVSAVTGREPMLMREMVTELEHGNGALFDCSKARTELGLEPVDTRTVVEEALRWAAFVGTLKSAAVDRRVAERLPADPAWPRVA